MLRSLSSGVAGMKAHQTKLDVIGNNISNVNTYGFKSSRTTFSSVFYQTISSSKASDTSGGGVSSTQIGYGSQVSGIDVLMTRSGFTSTGVTTDLAIAGEGFFQVQDAEGNKYYTRNGAFQFDSAGYLVDTNGNYVLGINGSTLGTEADALPIKVNLQSVDPQVGAYTDSINGKTLTITSTNKTPDSNISFTFTEGKESDFEDPNDLLVAKVSNGQIAIIVNPNAQFSGMDKFEEAVNEAITKDYGMEHPAGKFNINVIGADEGWPRTGKEMVSTDYTTQYGTVDATELMTKWGFIINGVGPEFSAKSKDPVADNKGEFEIAKTGDNFKVTYKVNDITYEREITPTTAGATIKLSNSATGASADDYIVVRLPQYEDIKRMSEAKKDDGSNLYDTTDTKPGIAVEPSAPSKCLGLGTTSYKLTGGGAGGVQTISDLTNIAIASDGSITATHGTLGTIEIGAICLATFDNPSGLDQASSTYFTESLNSGTATVVYAGEGGSGTLQSGALEMSNVDLSTEMADMITTERGFQAASRMITVSDEILQELINLKR